jgi:hypothetical protein
MRGFMNRDERAIMRTQFQLKVHQADAQAYEDLFTQVMQYMESGFKPIRPNGRSGDRKNDGYISDSGTYFQVYAPEDATKERNKTAAIEKAVKDFEGILTNWNKISEVRKYFFVLNDKYKGSTPELEQALSGIKTKYSLEIASVFLCKNLEDGLFSLEDDVIIKILGFCPNPENINVEFSVLSAVINHIIQIPINIATNSVLSVPDFNNKIQINNLTSSIATLLNYGSFQIGILNEYFRNNSLTLKIDIKEHLMSIYNELDHDIKETHSLNTSREDKVFLALCDRIMPRKNSKPYFDAAVVVLSYFFETCDIFREPK